MTPHLQQALGTLGVAMTASGSSSGRARKPDSTWLPAVANHAFQLAPADQWSEAHVDYYVRSVRHDTRTMRMLHSTTEPLVAATDDMLTLGNGGVLVQLLRHAAACDDCAAGAALGADAAHARASCTLAADAVDAAVQRACKGVEALPMFRALVAGALRARESAAAVPSRGAAASGPVQQAGHVPVFLDSWTVALRETPRGGDGPPRPGVAARAPAVRIAVPAAPLLM
jgi:hypothetical protein